MPCCSNGVHSVLTQIGHRDFPQRLTRGARLLGCHPPVLSTPDHIRLSGRDVPLSWGSRQTLYGWLVEADLAEFVQEIQMNNAFSSAMKPRVYDVLQKKLFTQGLDRELTNLRNGLKADLLSVPKTDSEGTDETQPGAG